MLSNPLWYGGAYEFYYNFLIDMKKLAQVSFTYKYSSIEQLRE
jgi:hypothetical protein